MRYIFLSYKRGSFPFEKRAELFVEYKGRWVHASQVPLDILEKAKAEDNFKAYVDTHGKTWHCINLLELEVALQALRISFSLKGERGRHIKNVDEALRNVETLIHQLEQDKLAMLLDREKAALESSLDAEQLERIIKIAKATEQVKPETFSNPKLYARLKREWKRIFSFSFKQNSGGET
ncbi:MAG: hypothetical protein ACPL0C_02910 [Candidatus Bathyarchaeales archaeon]